MNQYSQQIKDAARRLRRKGWSLRSIADKLGVCSSSQVCRWVNPHVAARDSARRQNYSRKTRKQRKIYQQARSKTLRGKCLQALAYSRYQGRLNKWEPCHETLQVIMEAFKLQQGRCKICGRKVKSLHLDHSHKTGMFRAWLCQKCNHALGLMAERPKLFVDYLENHK